MNGANGAAPRLLPQHLEDLRRSGLSDEQIAACRFRSETDPRGIGKLLGWRGPADILGPCLVIPFPEPGGTINGYCRVKPDNPRLKNDKKVKYESPVKKGNRVFFPPCTRAGLGDVSVPLIVTEGEKKAAKADQDGFLCLGLVGVYGWQRKRANKDAPRELIPDLKCVAWKGRTVYIVFDSDFADNPMVRWAEWHLAAALTLAGALVKVVRLPTRPDGAKVGLDDFLVAQGADELRKLLDEAKPAEKPQEQRPEIMLGPREFISVQKAIEVLANCDCDLYQRGGQLVRVTKPVSTVSRRLTGSGAPRIEPVPRANLRTRLTQHATICVIKKTGDGEEKIETHPTEWLVAQVGVAGSWPGVRVLEAVVTSPTLLRDGSVLQRSGYHDESGLLYMPEPDAPIPEIPANPTREDAQRALEALLEVVVNFPFAQEAHRAAWVAALLTLLARFAFDGPAPLFAVDANCRGAGKGLLLDTLALIAINRPFARAAYTRDDDEMRKVILSVGLRGEPAVLLDNIGGPLGNASLDAALTATEFEGRLLGTNQIVRVPLFTVWFCTANNLVLAGDTPRRTAHIRIETPLENPEERADLVHPELLAWVRANRGRLLVAALTILSAYCRAGKPDMKLRTWGSFEGWSTLIRNAVVWVGLPDPWLTRQALADHADRDAESLRGLICGWKEADPERNGRTVADVLKDMERNPSACPVLRAVFADAFDLEPGKLPSSGKLGARLRKFRGRMVGGECFDFRLHGGANAWFVCRPQSPGDGGHGGHGGHPQPCPNSRGGKAREASMNGDGRADKSTMSTMSTSMEEGDA
jgi:hypothetical protein